MISSIRVRRDVGSLFARTLSLLTAAVTLIAAAPAHLRAQADLVLNVSDSPDPSPATGDVLYTISVENNGATTATGVSYSLNVPSGARYRGATGVTCTGMSINQAGPATVTCALPNLAFNAVSNFALTLALDTQGVIPVSSSVIASNFAGGANNSVTVQTTVGAGADVSLSIASPASAPSGSTINYGITINNAGPSTASALRVQFPLPTGFLQQGALPAGCSTASNTVTCTVSGTIPSGGSLVVGNIPGKLTAGSVSTVTGTITVGLQSGAPGSTPLDPQTTNNSSVVNVGVTAGSDVRLTKTRSIAGPYFVGATFNFVLTPVYDGDSPTGLTMTDVVPSNYTVGTIASPQNGWTCSKAGQTVTCTRPSGGVAGASQSLGTVSIPVTVLTPGTGVTNSATISASSPTDPSTANNTATDGGTTLLAQTADLTISKSGPSPALAVVGVAYNYSVTASNGGPFAFFGTMSVTDTVPTGVTISAISATGWTCPALPVSGPAALTCTRVYTSGATLTSGSSAPTITLTATATQAGALTNRATVTSPDANVADPTPGNNLSSYTITASVNGDAANLSVLKSANLANVPAGEVLTYTLEVVNAGPAASTNITLTDVVGSLINGNAGAANGYVGQTVTRVGVASAVTCSNASSGSNSRTLTCTIPSLPVCTAGVNCPVVELQIRPGGNGGSRSNSATAISSTTADPSLVNNTGSVSVTVDPRADVTITKVGSPSPAVAGQNLNYTLTGVNNGPSQAFNVTVTDVLPLNVFFVSATPSTGSCSVTPTVNSVTTVSNRTVTCNLGTINNTAQGTVAVLVRPTTVTRGTSLINNASVTTSSTESASPGSGDNSASTTIPVSNPSLDLQLNKVDTVDPLTVSSNTVYNLTTTNNGPSDAENVVVTDTLPSSGFGFQSFTVSAGGSCPTVPAVNSVGGLLVCTFPRLASGASALVTVTLQGLVKGVYQNAGVVRSDETTAGFDILPLNNYATQRTTVRTRADMQVVSKVATPGSVAVRRPYTWLMTVRNNTGAGLAEADTVVVSDNLPAGSELTATPTVNVVSGTASSTTCTGTAGSTSFTCALGTVSSGAVITISLPVRSLTVPSGGIATNTASVTTTSLDVDGTNNSNSGTATITSSSLTGRVFRDFNNNAAVDAGDTGIGSISMLITGTAFDASAVSRTVSTAADGTFSVLELPEGTYNIQRGTVSEMFLTVGTQTAGSSGGTATTPPNISAITLGGTVAATDYRFAYVPQARLGLAKRVFGTPVANADGTITAVLRISARNYSLETLNTVNITDVLQGSAPAFGTYVAGGAAATLTAGTYTIDAAPAVVGTCSGSTPNAAYTGAASTGVAQITSLAAATTCEFGFTLRYRPTDPLPAGNYTNQANGTSVGALSGQTPSDVSHNGSNADSDADGNPGNNSTPTPLNAVLAADVTTSMTFPATVAAGQPISGAVTYRNNGPYTGTAAAFTMTLTSGLGTVTFGNLPGGATATYNNSTGAVVFTGMPTSLAPNVIASGNGSSGITVAYTQNGAANSTVTSGISTTSNEGPNVAPNSANANITGSLVVDVTTVLNFPATADAGTTINGTIAFRNFGPSTASGVTYSLTLATGLTGVTFGNLPGGATASYNATSGAVTFAGMPASLTSGQIASGNGSSFITLAYTQNGVANSSVTSAIATSTNQGANAATDNATLTVTGQPIADVTTSMAFPGSVNAGQPVSGTITLRNNGPSTAAGVTYSLTLVPGLTGVTFGNLPAGATAIYNSTTGGITFAGMPASLTSGQIASGNGSSPITLTYTQPGSGASTIASAIGTSTNQGANLAPDAASAAPGGALVADVRAQMSFPAAVNAGQPVVGTVRFGNDGPSPAATVAYTLNMTTGLTGVSFSNLPAGATASYNPTTGVVTFTGMPVTLASGDVASGDGLTGITVTYTQNAAASTTITATIATSTSQGANAAPDNATASVNGTLIADVTTALAFPASVPVGQGVSGTVTFRNAGPSSASGLTYGVTLATGLTGITFANLPAGATATYNSTTGAVTFSGMPATTAPNTIVSNDGVNGITINYTQPNALRTDITSNIGTSTDQGVNALTDVATVSIDGLQLTDLAVTKVAAFTDAAPGDTLTYRIRATNNGPVALNAGSTLTDENLVGMTLLQTRCSAIAGNKCVTAPTSSQLLASATLPALAATEFFEVEVDGVVTAVDGGTVSNAARVAVPSGFLDTDNTNDRASAPAVTVHLAPDLSLTKTADSVFIAGRPAQYTLSVQNVGLAATSGPITISDPLPAGVTFVSSSTPNWACAAAGQLVTCSSSNTLAPNASSSVSFGVTLAQSTVGTLLNTASVSTPRDRVVPNNSASVTRTVLGPPDLAVTKAIDVDTLRLGGAANWTVTVANAGGSATTGPITIVDSLPAGLTPTSAAGDTFTCTTVGQVVSCTRSDLLLAGATTSVQIGATLSPTAPLTPLLNTARASTAGDVNPANDAGAVSVPVGGQSVAVLRKTAVGEFVVGEPGRFRFAVLNTGTLPLVGPIVITDTLPRGLRYRSMEGAGWSCSTNGTATACTTANDIGVADSAVVTMVTDVLAEAVPEVTNCANVNARGGAIIGAAARSCVTVRPRGDYRLVLELTTPRYERELGDVPDFYVTIRNIGRSPLPEVRVTNLLPAGFVYAAGTSRRSGAPDRDFGPDGQPRNAAVQPLPGRNIAPIADPANAGTSSIAWPIGDMLPGDVIRIDYRAFIRSGVSFNADNITISSAVSDVASLSVQSNVARTPIRLRRGVFDLRGVIAGKVYAQCDCADSAGQQMGDVGVPGVRVVMEDGTGAITDAEGKYNFVNVRAGLHVVKVDHGTLPAGAAMVALTTRNAGDGNTRFVDLKAGELHRADFAARMSTPEAMEALLTRRRQGEPTAAGSGSTLTKMLAAPMTLGAAAPQQVQQAPVLGAQVRTDATGDMASTAYVPLAMPDIATSGNSTRAASPRRAAAQLTGQPNTTGRASVTVEMPSNVIPADGHRTVPVTVRVLDSLGKPVQGAVAVTLEASAGSWRVADSDSVQQGVQVMITNGAGVIPLVAPAVPTVAEVRATSAIAAGAQSVSFVPPMRDFMAAGLLQGRIDIRSLSRGGLVLSADDDVFEDALRQGAISRDSGQFRAGVRGAVLLKGEVKGAGLLTLAFDSERDPAKSQFRDITPDNGFQVFGDGSLREFDAQSQQRLYARLDRGVSSLTYGDFATPRSDDRRMLLSYDRSMTGLAYHAEGKRGIVNSFGARNSIRQIVDELPSRGLSGPYYLSRTANVVNSERIEIITRDRNQPSVILARQPMTRFEEYSVEPGTGRVVFRAPVPSLDANLNPVSIRVSYEVDQGGSQFYTYGVDGQLRISKGLEVGAFAVRDENPVDRQTLLGVNATAALGGNTALTGEYGRTETSAGTDPGAAWRLEMRHKTARLEGRIFAMRTDTAFSNRSSTVGGGRTEFGMRWSATVNDRTRLLAEGLMTEDERTGGKRTGASVGVERRLNAGLVAEVGYRWAEANGASVNPIIGSFVTGQNAPLAGGGLSANTSALNFNAARARLTARVPNSARASVFGEYERGLDASSATRGALGGEYLLFDRTRLYAQHEWISSQQGTYALAEDRDQQNTVIGIDADWLRNSQTFSEYRARDAYNGRDAEASIGLRNRWAVKRGVLVNTSFERVTPLAGSTSGAYAATGGLEWTASELWKGTARLEYRNSPTGDNVFGTLGYARKLSRDWTLLGRTGWDALQSASMRGRSQLGMAWRQTDRNTVNALFRWENRFDRTTSDGLPTTRTIADIAAALVNIQPNPAWTISTRYAAKVSRDRIDDVSVSNRAHLLMGRTVHDLSRRVDVGLIGSVLGNGSFSERRYGLGGELGYVVMRNLRLAGGYNLFGFSDRDFQSLGYTQRGPYLEFGFKFDETLFGQQRRGQESGK